MRVGIIGTGPTAEWGVLPALCGPDSLAPPDAGAWWQRRPAPGGDIRYQPPAQPEVVALCEVGELREGKASPRLEPLGRTFRVPHLFTDVRRMLRESALDAVFLTEESGLSPLQLLEIVGEAPAAGATKSPRWVWLDGPPVPASSELNAFARIAAAPRPALWMAAPGRRVAAHRAARRLIERGEIGPVTALQARFPFPLAPARFEAAFSAFDALLSFVARSHSPRDALAARHDDGATSLLVRFEGGATISALFCAADTWNSALPRFEICGTQGRFLVCEAGRRLWHHVPREGARFWEPPGLAPHVSSSNVSGYAEDIKAFLGVVADNPAPLNAERALGEAARALTILEAALRSLETGQCEAVEARGVRLETAPLLQAEPLATPIARNLTLDLG